MRKIHNLFIFADEEAEQKISETAHKRLQEGLDFLKKAQHTEPNTMKFFALAQELGDIVRDLTTALTGKEIEFVGNAPIPQVDGDQQESQYRAEHLKCKCGYKLPPLPGQIICPECGSVCKVIIAKSIGTTDDLVLSECAKSIDIGSIS